MSSSPSQSRPWVSTRAGIACPCGTRSGSPWGTRPVGTLCGSSAARHLLSTCLRWPDVCCWPLTVAFHPQRSNMSETCQKHVVNGPCPALRPPCTTATQPPCTATAGGWPGKAPFPPPFPPPRSRSTSQPR